MPGSPIHSRRLIAGGAVALALAMFASPAGARAGGAQYQSSSRGAPSFGYQVSFAFTQDSKTIAPESDDLIVVQFTNRSAAMPQPPKPLFGDDIVQEFSFSGQDFVNRRLQFTRRVRDKSFLDARYIRVVNHGGDGWEGDTISLTVDGEEIFSNFRMSRTSTKGFQNFNPKNWKDRSYWEEELSRHRRALAPR